MRRAVATGTAVLLVLAVGSVPAAAHTNTVEFDAQVSADGTVTVEAATTLVDGHVVVRGTSDSGGPGAALGHVPITRDDGFRQELAVPVDDDVWAEWGDHRTVWVALHRDEGDDGFDPDEDPVQEGFGGRVAQNATVAKGNAPARVLNERLEVPDRLETDAVSLREVAVGQSGLVVVRADNASGPVVGTRSVEAGVHHDVTVDLDDAVFDARDRELTLYAGLRIGGDTRSNSTQLRAGGEPVGTTFPVERVGRLATTATPDNATPVDGTPTPTATTVPGTTRQLVVTPSPTREASTPTLASPSVSTRTSRSPTGSTPTAQTGAGFTTGVTLAALVVAILACRHRR